MTLPEKLPGTPYGSPPKGAGPALTAPRWIVIHDTSNTATANDEAHYAANRTDARVHWTSAHFYVDAGGPLGSVMLTEQAWAAFSNANAHGLHIEMCGHNAGENGAVSAATIQHTATLVHQLAQLAGIPMVKIGPADIAAGKPGIAGHLDFTQEEHRAGGHDDPGPRFDWAGFIRQVQNGGTPLPPPPPATTSNETENIVKALPLLKKDVGHVQQSVKNAQGLLDAHGMVGADGHPLSIDGDFGPNTDYATRRFQERSHVANSVTADGHGDGQIGTHTWAALLNV